MKIKLAVCFWDTFTIQPFTNGLLLVQGYLKSQSVYFKTQENSKYSVFLLDCVVIDIGGSVVNIKGQELVLLLRNSFFIA